MSHYTQRINGHFTHQIQTQGAWFEERHDDKGVNYTIAAVKHITEHRHGDTVEIIHKDQHEVFNAQYFRQHIHARNIDCQSHQQLFDLTAEHYRFSCSGPYKLTGNRLEEQLSGHWLETINTLKEQGQYQKQQHRIYETKIKYAYEQLDHIHQKAEHFTERAEQLIWRSESLIIAPNTPIGPLAKWAAVTQTHPIAPHLETLLLLRLHCGPECAKNLMNQALKTSHVSLVTHDQVSFAQPNDNGFLFHRVDQPQPYLQIAQTLLPVEKTTATQSGSNLWPWAEKPQLPNMNNLKKQRTKVNHKSQRIRFLDVHMPPPPMVIDLCLGHKSNPIYALKRLMPQAPLLYPKLKTIGPLAQHKWHRQTLEHLLTFFERRAEEKPPYRREQLTEAELAYATAMDEPLIFFIPGYNIPQGQWGPGVLLGPQLKPGANAPAAQWSDVTAPGHYQSPHCSDWEKHYGTKITQDLKQQPPPGDTING